MSVHNESYGATRVNGDQPLLDVSINGGAPQKLYFDKTHETDQKKGVVGGYDLRSPKGEKFFRPFNEVTFIEKQKRKFTF